MKINAILFTVVVSSTACCQKKVLYTGSTPASAIVRSFLDIPLSDSIDFIRWDLSITKCDYTLSCNYGIGKPNTNGFINGGKKISFDGEMDKSKNNYYLQKGDKQLGLLPLNDNLLLILDNNNRLLTGNGGWSYTLCNKNPVSSNDLNYIPQQPVLSDSMTFTGRTPCAGIPGYPAGSDCYKLKWSVVLYGNTETNQATGLRIRGTFSDHQILTGNWSIIKGKNGRYLYQLNIAAKNEPFYLLRLDENILLFTDANENPLIGNEDFSYTLNREH